MTIKQIYKKYFIPPNLQEHMLRVTSIVKFIESHWLEGGVKWNVVLKASLLHDLGNIVKFKLNPEDPLQSLKETMIAKYGPNDNIATQKMLVEIGVNKDIKQVIFGKSFSEVIKISLSGDWETKILMYADFRVLPSGIGSLDERLTDVRTRLAKYANNPDLPEMEAAMRNIEAQIQKNMTVLVSQISDKIVRENNNNLLSIEI